MIKIKCIREEPCFLFTRGILLGKIESYLSLNDIRLQIVEKKLEGYYIVFRGEKIHINKSGSLEKWPKGLFDTLDKQLMQLFKNGL